MPYEVHVVPLGNFEQFLEHYARGDVQGALECYMSRTASRVVCQMINMNQKQLREKYIDSYKCKQCGYQHFSGSQLFTRHAVHAQNYCEKPKLNAVIAKQHWRAVRDLVKARSAAIHWLKETQEALCAPGGTGRKRDLQSFLEG